jgi:alpha-1,6-mannosyltransferase
MLCALAAGVKSPAALGVVFLGWVWAGEGSSIRRRVGHTLGAGLIGLATIEAVALATGTGWGWIRTTTTADAAFTGVTPINVVARGVSIFSHVLQVPIATLTVRPVFIVLGVLVALGLCVRFLWRSPQEGVVRNLGLALLCLALLGPIVWAWYVTWGIVVLAAVAAGRLRRAVIVISTFWAFAGVTSMHGIYMRLIHTFVLPDLLLVAMLLAVAITPLGQFSSVRPRLPRLPRLSPPGEGNGVLAGAAATP